MARIPRIHFPGAVFHAIARGNARQRIFLGDGDWARFLRIAAEVKQDRPFKLYAYCLMSNHLHLLLEPIAANLSTIMGLILGRYAKHFNASLQRTGHVFQDRFKAILCQKDPYLRHLVRYIHLNPVKAGMVAEPSAWPYSGHREYLGDGPRGLVDTELLLSMFHDDAAAARAAYVRFVQDGIPGLAGSPAPQPPAAAPPRPAVGGPRRARPVEFGTERPSLDELFAAAARDGGVPLEALRRTTRVRAVSRARRGLVATAFRAGYSLTEIAAQLGQSVSATSKALRATAEG